MQLHISSVIGSRPHVCREGGVELDKKFHKFFRELDFCRVFFLYLRKEELYSLFEGREESIWLI